MSSKEIVSDFDWEDKTWDVIDTFFKQDKVLIQHHINSYNYFMEKELQGIVFGIITCLKKVWAIFGQGKFVS